MSNPDANLPSTSVRQEPEEAEPVNGENDLVDLGSVSNETRGNWQGKWYDGGFGYFG